MSLSLTQVDAFTSEAMDLLDTNAILELRKGRA